MKDWENIVKNKDLLSKVEDWVRGLTINSPQEVFVELNRLTGNNWSREEYESHIFDYPDFNDLEEVVYALFHNGDYPDRKSEDCEAWNIKKSVDEEKNVCSFFILSKYKKDKEKCFPIILEKNKLNVYQIMCYSILRPRECRGRMMRWLKSQP